MRTIKIAGVIILLSNVIACTSPLAPSPQWTEHTYYCENVSGTVAYTVLPGHGTCDAGDITIKIDPPIAGGK
jgi:hypothetical protein